MRRSLLAVAGLVFGASATASADPGALLVVENTSAVDLALDLSVDGTRVPGCFWVLAGKSATFTLPPGKLAWSYSLAGMHLTGKLELSAEHPRMLRCQAARARTGDEIARCEPAAAPESPPPGDAMAALASTTLSFLEELSRKVRARDAKALGPLLDLPLDVEWAGGRPGKKRVKSAKQLIELRDKLELDDRALAAAKARGGDPRTGDDDCEKGEVDWARGEPALSCDGREVVIALRPGKACEEQPRVNTWRLRNAGASWKLSGKSARP